MSKTFKMKLAGLGGVVIALVITSGCMGGGGGKGAQEYAQEACSNIARTCQDGSMAVKKEGEACMMVCPEDKQALDALGNVITGSGTGTATSTSTSTSSSTTTQTTCTSETFACADGSIVGRDSSNGCAFKACPAN